MLGLLIGFGIFAIMFVLYCCCIVAGQYDRDLDEHLIELIELKSRSDFND